MTMLRYDVWYKGRTFDAAVDGEYVRTHVSPDEVSDITIAGEPGQAQLTHKEIVHLCATGRLLRDISVSDGRHHRARRA